jgi:diadenosine tetraphosphate (Ap4A) HIT family hydrolase
MTEFRLHPQLARDAIGVGELPLSRVLLLNDSRYPWLILVPRRADITELFQLDELERRQLCDEVCHTGEQLLQAFGGDKLNIGALGNMVPQLHIHLVIRRRDDPAWPGPVWGHSAAQSYAHGELEARLRQLKARLPSLQPLSD